MYFTNAGIDNVRYRRRVRQLVLQVSENLLSIYLDEYQDTPWEALKYLIAGICYGGQVTDEWDRKLLNTYINQYFNENVLTTAYYR